MSVEPRKQKKALEELGLSEECQPVIDIYAALVTVVGAEAAAMLSVAMVVVGGKVDVLPVKAKDDDGQRR